jgi:polyisoprenoid-binding protein YceI
MDENMYKALKAEQYPDIRYTLATYEVDRDSATADSFVAKTTGQLTVSGQTITVEIPIKVQRTVTGAARGEGKVDMLMTDFGIKPPVALLGTLRTKNKISISFNVLLDKSTVVALSQQQ